MPHRIDCPCPACRYRRGEDKGQAPQLSVRVAPDVRDYLLAHPDGARATVERLVAQDRAGLSREEERAAESHQSANKLLKEENADLRRTVRELAFQLQNANAALQHARHGLLKFAQRSPGDIFTEHPDAIAVVARGALDDMDAALAAQPLPRSKRRARR